jgi:two-component system sensor kinase FixL
MRADWISVVWPVMAGMCLALGLIYLVIWRKQVTHRTELAAAAKRLKSSPGSPFIPANELSSLAFSALAVSVGIMIIFEMLLMDARTPREFGEILRWIHIPFFAGIVSTAVFVRSYFQAGRLWLAYVAVALRFAGFVLNFYLDPNINYLVITDLTQVEVFGGEIVSVARGIRNPWLTIMEVGSLLLLAFMVDAVITCWRRGGRIERRRALVVGLSLLFMVAFMVVRSLLIHAGLVHSVYMFGFPFLLVFVAISYEFGTDMVRSVRLAGQLQTSESALSASEQRVTLASEAGQLGIWEWDSDRDEVWINHQGCALYGFSVGERIGYERFSAILHPEDRAAWQHETAQLLITRGNFEHDYRIVLPDGKVRWIVARGRAENDAESRAVVVRGVSLDITERKLAEQRFREVVESAPNGLVIFDTRGCITLVNARAAQDFGYSRDELLGQHVSLLIPERFRAQHALNHSRFADRVALNDMAKGRDVSGRHKDGHEIPLEISLSSIDSQEGPGVLASIIDVSARKQSELELEQQRNELAHLSRVTMLSELSGSLAHELNQPLTAILSNAQAALRFMAGNEPKLDEVREILNDIVSDDRRAGEIIQGLRLLLKKGERKKDQLDINEVINSVLRLIRSDLLNSNIVLTTRLAADLPTIIGDPVQLQQVFLNLVANSCDAMRDNSPADRQLLVSSQLAADDCIHICVADQGLGIPPESLDLVFDAFFTTKKEGLGLGLSVCRQIIAAHDGILWAENNTQRGASFFFSVRPHRDETP